MSIFFFSAVLQDVFALLLKEHHRKKNLSFFFLSVTEDIKEPVVRLCFCVSISEN